ncbi:MAG: o-succinylbenzoate--CoA ligase [Chlorobium sp.]|uniref:o-succinylbenzoate--CoA ligase n=1 Tax=Chlorobium sp. TaxID=1095 RepID=UPI0025C41970|nr:o-succinylbenzoate--CoA ligase [Chlorobium sp.]MCF8382991.1 o-succinylbenzoate--CoA ligase [Chlorobium sp.]
MDLVNRASLLFDRSPALISSGTTRSFRECAAVTSHMAETLHKKGLHPGTTAAILSPNTPEAALTAMALLRTGIICAPLNHRFPSEQLGKTLHALQPDLVLAADPSCIPPQSAFRTENLRAVAAAPSGHAIPIPFAPQTGMERPVTIIHTSASSGTPKAALHSFGNHWYSALGAARNMQLESGDCWLLSLPLFHIGGYAVLFRALASGSAVAVPDPQESLERSIERYPVTHLSLVPTQLFRLLDNPAALPRLRKLKAVLLGGSAVPAPLLEKSIREEIPIYLSYGSTEMCSQIATTPAPVRFVEENSGKPLPWRDISIAGDGEILVKGACLFQGYLVGGKPVLRLDDGGWFHTGDTGSLDDSGNLRVFGRKDNMFIAGGENLHPEEIEEALTAIEGIEEALVVPLRDREYGQRPVAFIKTATPESPSEDTINESMLNRAGRLKTPVRYIRVSGWTTLPGSQKIDRKWYIRQIDEGNLL